ncbi:hypothetical protein N9Q52_01640 [Polaribacter sp.]|jgi:hypothetical protein|nr:hypothetical protein [Polaribacter sp.]
MKFKTRVKDGSNRRKSESKMSATETLKKVLELLNKKPTNEN